MPRTKNKKPAEKAAAQRPFLPGISYAPDALEIAEFSFVRDKVTYEFVDFVRCVHDILTLLEAIKMKHMRSTKPLPFDVIREILHRDTTKNRTRTREFELNLPNLSQGISPSVDSLLRPEVSFPSSMMKVFKGNRPWNTIAAFSKRRKTMKRQGNLYFPELAEIVGKRTKPIWHTTAKEKEETIADVFNKQNRVSSKDKLAKAMLMMGERRTSRSHSRSSKANQKFEIIPITREKRVRSDFSIKFATSEKTTNREPSKKQQEIMEAHAAGFENVDSHRAWQKILEPHWYMDLVSNAIKLGIPNTEAVREEFTRLSKFFEMNCTSFPLARAKLCFLVQSLPTWDICRMCIQRAIEFVLSDVLTTPNASKDLQDWLMARHLPYVVLPPKRSSEPEEDNNDLYVGQSALNVIED